MSYHAVGSSQELGGVFDTIMNNTLGKVGKAAGWFGRKTVKQRTKAVDFVCKTARTPGAAQGAAAASGGVGAVAVIGAAALCGPGQVAVPIQPFPPPMSMTLPLLLGGGLILIAVLTKKKKKKVPTP